MAIEITSPQNPRIKDFVSLRERRGRQSQRRFIIDGIREIHRARAAKLRITEVCFDPQLCQDVSERNLLSALEADDAVLIEVSSRVMEKLSYGQRQLPLIAIAEIPSGKSLDDLTPNENALVVILEAIEKPGNLGAILRTADAAQVQAVILSNGKDDLYNPNVIRSSCGAVFHLPVINATHAEVEHWLASHKFNTFATRVDGAIDYTRGDYQGRSAIVMGAEATGLSDNWHADNSTAIRIPMHGVGDSLNVSTSCAVICFEALRQRTATAS